MATFGTTIGSGGLKAYDAGHEVSYNYVEGVYGGPAQGPLLLDSGEVEGSSTNLSAHWRVVNALVERNVLVNDPEGIRIGNNYSLAPTGCTIRDNIVAQAVSGTAVTQSIAPVSSTLTNNVYYATPATGGLAQDSTSIWRKAGYGPRLTFLQAGDVGPNGDPNDADGTGVLIGGGGTPPPPPTVTKPTFVAMGTPVTGSSTSITVPAPSGAQTGDFHLIVITSTANETITSVPSGWTLLGYQPITSPTSPNRGGDAVAAAYYTLSDPGSVTFTKSGSAFFHAVRGIWRGVGGVGQSGVTAIPAGSALNTPTMSAANTDSLVVGVVAADLPTVSAGPYSPPAGWTERYDTTQTGGTDNLSISIAEVSAAVAPSTSDSAAELLGWGEPFTESDEFGYSGAPNPARWEVLSGAGFNGNGTRSTARVTVNGSAMVLTGQAGSAVTGAVLHAAWRRYGRWEARVRSSVSGSGTNDYRVNLLLWPADGVTVPSTTQQDLDTSDSPEATWPHSAGVPGGRIVVNFAVSGLSARYDRLVRQAADIWSRSSVVEAVVVDSCPVGSNCCTVRTKPIGSDPDTDGETDSNDSGSTRLSSTVTYYTNWLDSYPDSGALATIVHEMGHVFGLIHRLNPNDLMNANTDENTNPIPDAIDFANLAAIYAAGAGGQYAFLEATQAGQSGATITLHYPRLSGSDVVETVTVPGLDLTQWHNFAIEWSSTQIIVWIDGIERFRKSGGATSTRRNLQDNRGPMRLGVQLDALASSGMRAAQVEVEWARAYALGSGTTNPANMVDAVNVSFTGSGGVSSTYHIFGAGLPGNGAGLVMYFHGDGDTTDGIFDYDDPTDVYAIAGNRGMAAVSKAKGYVFVAAKTPDTTGPNLTWWEDSRNIQYAADLINKLVTTYQLNRSKIWLTGYSGGGEFISENFLPAKGAATLDGGGAVILGGGDGAQSTPTGWTAAFKSAFPMNWVTGILDDGTFADDNYNAIADAQNGSAYYANQGFTTTLTTPPWDHDIDGAFGPIIDDYLPAMPGASPPSRTPGSTRPTLITSYLVTGTGTASLTTTSFTPSAGEVIVVKAWTASQGVPTFDTCSGGGMNYATKAHVPATGKAEAYIFVGEVGATSPGSMTVSTTWRDTSGPHGMVVERWSSGLVRGAPAASSPLTGSGAPLATLTPTSANSVLTWLCLDKSAVSGTAVYRSSATQTQSTTATIRAYAAYQPSTSTTAQTIGLSAPSGQSWTMAAVELLPGP